MTEILTESFCERCGSRYTFESAVPKDRLRRVKVLSRGLKTFVLDDKTSFDEALAAARSDTDREATSSQLDAFHRTFNFCMQCRQYTCPDCWNEAEGRCLTCAPLAHQVAAAPLPGLEPAAPPMTQAPSNGSAPFAATNGSVPAMGAAAAAANGHAPEHAADGFDPIARLDALSRAASPVAEPVAEPAVDHADAATQTAESVVDTISLEPEPDMIEPISVEAEVVVETPVAEPVVVETPVAEPEFVVGTPVAEPEVVSETISLEPDVVVEPPVAEPVVEAVVAEPTVIEPVVEAAAEPTVEAVVAEPVIEPLDELVFEPVEDHLLIPIDEPIEEVVLDLSPAPESLETVEPPVATEPSDTGDAAVAAATGALVAGLLPGQSIDDAIDAFERDEPDPEIAVEPEAIVIAAEPEPAAVVEAEPIVAAPEPEPVIAAEPEPEPVAAAVEPIVPATPPAVDVVEQPTWTIVAPDAAPASTPVVVPPVADPQWPATPEWPTQQASPGLPFLGRPAVPTGGVEALWAASDREVTTAPVGDRPVAAVQACVSCGLSLSATARFCRRCGTAQH